jgi:hypothetical protein
MLRSVDIVEKRLLLLTFKTKEILVKLEQVETDLETALQEEGKLKTQYQDYVCGRSDDCKAVKDLEAKIAMEVPEKEGDKKLTADAKKAWQERQRTENKELAAAIDKQKMAAFVLEDAKIKIDMARTKLQNMRSVLELKTAQILYCASNIQIAGTARVEQDEAGNVRITEPEENS